MFGGMDMMLKAMGLDPEEMKKSIEGFGALVIDVNERLERIERNQRAIMLDMGIPIDFPPSERAASKPESLIIIENGDNPHDKS